jgi:hypothetical protein
MKERQCVASSTLMRELQSRKCERQKSPVVKRLSKNSLRVSPVYTVRGISIRGIEEN